MNVADIHIMRTTRTLLLTKAQKLSHFAIVPFLLIVPLFTTYSLIEYYFFGTYTGVREPHELISGYFFLFPAVAFYILQRNRLKFKVIPVKVDNDTLIKAVGMTAKELNWVIEKQTDEYIMAVRKGGLFKGGSWGEMITIIKDHERIYINSICDPDSILSVASYGWNRKNVKTFTDRVFSLHTT